MTGPYDLALIDASSWIHRAFHAFPALSTRDGRPTGALTGCVATLLSQIAAGGALHGAKRVAAVFDAPAKTFRHTIDPTYKRGRVRHDDLRQQFTYVREAFAAFGIHTLEQPGVEADDVIAVWALAGRAVGMDVAILSTDKDLTQILTGEPGFGSIVMVDSMGKHRGTVCDSSAVLAKWGVMPSQMASLLALVGDQTDGIPGIPGIGVKTAAQLLNEYGPNLKDLLAHTYDVANKRMRMLLDMHYALALAAYRMIRLPSPDAPAIPEPELSAARFDQGTIDPGRIVAFCNEFEMRSTADDVLHRWAMAEV